MTTVTVSTSLTAPFRPTTDLITGLWRRNRPLTLVGLAHLGLALVALAGMLLDPRMLTGQPIWTKPFKFAVSIALYTLTLAWILARVEDRPRWVALVSWATAIGFLVEILAIVTQVLRGVRSHFNVATPYDAAVFGAMGAFVLLIWVMNLLAAGLLFRQTIPDRPLAWSLRLGLVITALGAGLGFLMTTQTTAEQAARIEAGLPMLEAGAHAVGEPDGGAGLPLTGWSTEGGDIRVPHFVGLHAMQLLPLLAIALGRRRRRRGGSEHRDTAIVGLAGLAYLSLTLVLTWQALRGQPLIAPDAATLGALAITVGVPALAAALLTMQEGHRPRVA